jgi:small subunit ribosomal protein S1
MSQNDAISVQGSEETEDPEVSPADQAIEPQSEASQEPAEEKKVLSMEDLMDQLDEDAFIIDLPKAGEIRDGIIASISEGQILVSVGAKSEGIITGKEYEAIPQDFLSTLEVGKAIPVYVITPEDSSGNLILSFIRAVEEQSWVDAEELLKSGEAFDSKIVGYNKGGLLVMLSTIRGFIPASQLSFSRRLGMSGDTPEAKYKEMIGQDISVCVIEVDRGRHRLILSERAASSETREQIRDMILEDLKEGDVRKGRVTSIADFGAFVNIGGADGLVHLSEITYDHITHPSEKLEVGKDVKVKVISVDRDRRRIGLSIRALKQDPWFEYAKSLTVGQLVEAEITRLTSFGAFAKLNVPGDLEGLIHISEISDRRVDHPKAVLKSGEQVTLRILKIDEEDKRIGLSLRRVDSAAYADFDWKTIAEDFDLIGDDEGETLATIVGEEPTAQAEELAEAVEEKAEELAEDTAETVEEVAEVVEEVVETVEEGKDEETPEA